jgi:hypothetical protein
MFIQISIWMKLWWMAPSVALAADFAEFCKRELEFMNVVLPDGTPFRAAPHLAWRYQRRTGRLHGMRQEIAQLQSDPSVLRRAEMRYFLRFLRN